MLKVLTILALLLYVSPVQAYPQTDKAQNAKKSDKPASTTAPVAPQNTGGPQLQPVPEKHVNADVRVVSTPEKDGYDRAAFWINAALGFVGCIGIGIGVCTLIYLRKQAGEMRLQRKVMVRSLRAMREQGERENKTIVLQYRPKVIVRNAKATGIGIEHGAPGVCKLEFLLVNTGGSPAHIIKGSISLLSYDASGIENTPFIDGPELHVVEGVLQAGERLTIKEESMKTGTVNDAQWMLYYSGKNPDRTILLMGNIWYKDEIGITRPYRHIA